MHASLSSAEGLGRLDPVMERRADGSILVRSRQELGPTGRCLTDSLEFWAERTPEALLFAERGPDGQWRRVSYAEALGAARRIASGLLAHDLSAERPVAILSGNGINHALLALAAMMIGVPYCPISPAYSLVSQDFAKLRYAVDLLTPGLVFAESGKTFGRALKAIERPGLAMVAAQDAEAAGARAFSEFRAAPLAGELAAARAAVGPETIAKFLLTSGSTGEPKAVINTQAMMMVNQAMLQHCFPFLTEKAPVLVDWLPWNHTFGANHNFNMALVNGGALYIDAGKPVPGGIAATVANLREIAPTAYFNVPKGFEALLPELEADDAFARHFFSDLRMLFYAGAGLAREIWDGYQRLARRITGRPVVFVTGLGATETAPAALVNLMASEAPGNIGHPMPGITIKLVPTAGKLEIRVKGQTITPGYWRSPVLTAKAFDDEGFYCFGDAARFAVPGDPAGGFIFDGRISEDFKLATGTWVSVGPLRAAFLSAFSPLAKDVVITGHDRDDIGAMVFPDIDRCRQIAGTDAPPEALLALPAVREAFRARLKAFAAEATGSSNRVTRLVLLAELPSIDKGEITDKGSINQRAVLAQRQAELAALYAANPPSAILRLTDAPSLEPAS